VLCERHPCREPGARAAPRMGDTRSPAAHARTGRRRRELQHPARTSLDQRTKRRELLSPAPCRRMAGLSPGSGGSGAGVRPTCRPGSTAPGWVLLEGRAAAPQTPKSRPFPPKASAGSAHKAEADGSRSTPCPYRGSSCGPAPSANDFGHLMFVSVNARHKLPLRRGNPD